MKFAGEEETPMQCTSFTNSRALATSSTTLDTSSPTLATSSTALATSSTTPPTLTTPCPSSTYTAVATQGGHVAHDSSASNLQAASSSAGGGLTLLQMQCTSSSMDTASSDGATVGQTQESVLPPSTTTEDVGCPNMLQLQVGTGGATVQRIAESNIPNDRVQQQNNETTALNTQSPTARVPSLSTSTTTAIGISSTTLATSCTAVATDLTSPNHLQTCPDMNDLGGPERRPLVRFRREGGEPGWAGEWEYVYNDDGRLPIIHTCRMIEYHWVGTYTIVDESLPANSEVTYTIGDESLPANSGVKRTSVSTAADQPSKKHKQPNKQTNKQT